MGIAQNALSSADPDAWSCILGTTGCGVRPQRVGGQHPGVDDAHSWRCTGATSTGIAMARTAGVLGSWLRDEEIDAAYGWREMFVPDERLDHSRCLLGRSVCGGR